MKTASVSTTKNQLSALLEQVRLGETILITDHDRPVAKLVPAGGDNGAKASGELAILERKGIIRRGHGAPCRLMVPPTPAGDASALAVLLDERESGR